MTDDKRDDRDREVDRALDALLAEAVPEPWGSRETAQVLAAIGRDQSRRRRGRLITIALSVAASAAALTALPWVGTRTLTGARSLVEEAGAGTLRFGGETIAATSGYGASIGQGGAIVLTLAAAAANLWLARRPQKAGAR